MGVYTRLPRSKYYWLWLGREGGKARRERTDVLVDAPTVHQRKAQRQLADHVFHQRMADLARGHHGLAETKPAITFVACADLYEQHVLPDHRGSDREREILPRLRAWFGATSLRTIDRDLARAYTTARTVAPPHLKAPSTARSAS